MRNSISVCAILPQAPVRVNGSREFDRVGGNTTIKVDIRLIAATNRDLKEMSKTGAFRQDLYYRLNVVAIHTPALRERREDIPALASHFIAKYSERVKRKVSGISPKAHKLLSRYDWPGNVRELENAIERAVVLGVTEVILPEDLPELMIEVHDLDASDDGDLFESAVRTAKVQIIEKTLDQTQGNQNEAAKLLGMHPVHLSRLMKSFNVKPKRR